MNIVDKKHSKYTCYKIKVNDKKSEKFFQFSFQFETVLFKDILFTKLTVWLVHLQNDVWIIFLWNISIMENISK